MMLRSESGQMPMQSSWSMQPRPSVPVWAGMETIAKRYATWSATFGFLVAATPWLVLGWGNLAEFQYLRALVIGCLVTLAVARAVAAYFALSFARASRAGAGLLGAVAAVFALEIGTVAGSIPQFVGDDWSFGAGQSAFDYLVKPLFWINFAGLLPALVIGLSAGVLLRRALRRIPTPL